MMEIEKMDSFIYLGVLITKQNITFKEIKANIVKDDKRAGSLNTSLRSKEISRGAKMQVYRTILTDVKRGYLMLQMDIINYKTKNGKYLEECLWKEKKRKKCGNGETIKNYKSYMEKNR